MGRRTLLTAIKKSFLALGLCFHPILRSCLTARGIERSIKDPQILELSGIGRPDILNKIGVELKVELPGVGENVQEHVMNFSTYELAAKEWGPTGDLRKDEAYSAQAFKEQYVVRSTLSVSDYLIIDVKQCHRRLGKDAICDPFWLLVFPFGTLQP